MNKSINNNTLKLVTSGILIGLAVVLSFITIYKLPYGGSITFLSMVPIIVLAYTYGTKWGLLCGAVYGLLQAILGATQTQAFAGVEGYSVILMGFLDYILAFTVLGFGGVFKNVFKNKLLALVLGGFLACLLRFICHFLSGYILWSSYAQWFFEDVMNNDFGAYILNTFSGDALAALYSLIYNGSYMSVECVLTVFGLIAIYAIKPIRKIMLENNKPLKQG